MLSFDWITTPEGWIALATLTALEIVLGIDNIVFISILSARLPEEQQPSARRMGLMVAMVMRLVLLFSLSWMMTLTEPLFSIASYEFSGRGLILLVGGLFLLGKSTHEIHNKLEGDPEAHTATEVASYAGIVVQIGLLDLVFSFDSVITAVGVADDLMVMVIAIIVAILVMMAAAEPISSFVEKHPTVKMLALSFLLLIGFSLVAEGLGLHIPKGYIYVAMGFSLVVELLNLRVRKRRRQAEPVALRGPHMPTDD